MLLVVLWCLHAKRSLRNLAEMFLERGFVCTHEAVRDWEARFAPRFGSAHDELRDHVRARQRQGERVPLADQRRVFSEGLAEVNALPAA